MDKAQNQNKKGKQIFNLSEVSPAYLLSKFIDQKIERFNAYYQRENATEQAIQMMRGEIEQLQFIHSRMKDLEPIGLMQRVAEAVRRNSLLGVDITVILIPNRLNIPPYPHAMAVMADLTPCNIPDAHALLEMHQSGLACVEVEDMTGNKISDVLALYANRGNLYTDTL